MPNSMIRILSELFGGLSDKNYHKLKGKLKAQNDGPSDSRLDSKMIRLSFFKGPRMKCDTT